MSDRGTSNGNLETGAASGLERWRGRVALVTGATAGIGAACVPALLNAGLRVVACGRRADRLEALADRASVDGHGDDLFVQTCDLRREVEIRGLFEAAQHHFGGVDVLVNNAGLGHKASLSGGDDDTTEQWREMLDVNVLALCICTREALRDMRRRGVDDGQIVHISSMAGHRVPPGSGVYAATKHAVRALTEGLRAELREEGSDIRVGAISPGFVETEFAAVFSKSEQVARETYGRYPVLQPEDVAEALLYLLAQPAHVQVHDVLMRPTRQPG